jgi:hypothetical protein
MPRRANKLAGVLFSVKAITQENIGSGKIMRADLAYGFNRLKHRHVRRVRADRADRNVIGAVTHQRNQRARKPAPSIHPRRRLKPSLRRASTSLFSLVERERMGNTTVEITGGVATTVSPAPLPGAPLPVVTSPAPVVSEKVSVVRPFSVIPADVELEPFVDAQIPTLRRYSYFVSPSNKIVVVEPVGCRVVRVLER